MGWVHLTPPPPLDVRGLIILKLRDSDTLVCSLKYSKIIFKRWTDFFKNMWTEKKLHNLEGIFKGLLNTHMN